MAAAQGLALGRGAGRRPWGVAGLIVGLTSGVVVVAATAMARRAATLTGAVRRLVGIVDLEARAALASIGAVLRMIETLTVVMIESASAAGQVQDLADRADRAATVASDAEPGRREEYCLNANAPRLEYNTHTHIVSTLPRPPSEFEGAD